MEENTENTGMIDVIIKADVTGSIEGIEHELEKIRTNENLDRDATYKFIKSAFRDGSVPVAGTAISEVLPPVSRFSPTGDRTKKRDSVLNKLTNFFERFFDISGGNFPEQK